MKSITKFAAVAAATVLAAGVAQAATSITGTATATVTGALSVVQTSPLNFGSFSAGTTAGTINNYGVTTGGTTVISAGGPAIFTANGNANTNFTITASSTVVLTSGVNSMTAALTAPSFSALDNVGARAFNVIGTLTVPANQAAGSYTGTYNVSVNY